MTASIHDCQTRDGFMPWKACIVRSPRGAGNVGTGTLCRLAQWAGGLARRIIRYRQWRRDRVYLHDPCYGAPVYLDHSLQSLLTPL